MDVDEVKYAGKWYKIRSLHIRNVSMDASVRIASDELLRAITTKDGELRDDSEARMIDELIYHFVADGPFAQYSDEEIAKYQLDEEFELCDGGIKCRAIK
jgi:hypothetical protein